MRILYIDAEIQNHIFSVLQCRPHHTGEGRQVWRRGERRGHDQQQHHQRDQKQPCQVLQDHRRSYVRLV